MSENPYESPQAELGPPQDREPAVSAQLAPDDESLPKILLLKLVLFCLLSLGELYLVILFLDRGLVAWEIYLSPLIPGPNLKPGIHVFCIMGVGSVMEWTWRSMD